MSFLTKFDAKSARVKGLSFHPNRPWILSSLHNGIIQLWDYRCCTLIEKFEGHEGPVRGIDFHPNQPLFVSGGDDLKIRVWNYKQKKCLFILSGHQDYIRTTFFHQESPWVLSSSDDQTIRIWNWQSRTVAAILTGHSHYVMCAQFHPTESLVVSASLDQTVRVWDISGLRKKNIAPTTVSKLETHLRQGASSLLGSGGGAPAELFGTGDVAVRHVMEGHDSGVNWASFHPTLPLIVSASDDKLIKIWRFTEQRAWEVDTFRGHYNNVSCALFHPRQDLLLSVSEDKSFRVWDLERRSTQSTHRRESDRFWTCTSHPKLNLFAIGHDSGFCVLKLERERPAFTLNATGGGEKDVLFYVKPPYLRRLELGSSKDSPVVQLREGRGPAVSLAYHPIENAILVTSRPPTRGSESTTTGSPLLSYDLYALAKNSDSPSTGLASEARSGSGLAVAWIARNRFAVLEPSAALVVKNLSNEKVKRIQLTYSTVDQMFSATTGNVLLKDSNAIHLYDVGQQRKLASLKNAKEVCQAIWSPDCSYVALCAKLCIYIANRRLELVTSVTEQTRIKSGAWSAGDDVFIYTTSNHVKYALLNGANGIVRTLDLPVYLTRIVGNHVYCLDRSRTPLRLTIDPTEYKFKLALLHRRYDEVLNMVRNCNLVGQAIIGYLERNGFPEVALHFVKEPRTRFTLAIGCGQLEVALDAAHQLTDSAGGGDDLDSKVVWDQLAGEALRLGNLTIAELALQKAKAFDRLAFIYLITGNLDKLNKMMKIAELRRDVSTHYQLALLLGNVKERVKVLRNSDQAPLAYLTAKTYGLDQEASELEQATLITKQPEPIKSSIAFNQASLCLPPPPLVRQHDQLNWPLLTQSRDIFETSLATATGPQRLRGDEPQGVKLTMAGDFGDSGGQEGEWGAELDLEADFADAKGGQQNKEVSSEQDEEEGWDLGGDDEIDLPDQLMSSADLVKQTTFIAPSLGQPMWVNCDSRLVGDLVGAGLFVDAMRLLNSQVGVVSFDVYRPLFASIYAASRSMSSGLPLTPSHFLFPSQLSSCARPLPCFTLNRLLDQLQQAYQATTKGRFAEAIDLFRLILLSVPLLTGIESAGEEAEARSLIGVCKEYLLGLSMELTRKALPKESQSDQIRNVELACYFTHCQLETPHLILTLRTAFGLLFKLKNYQSAILMGRRLLDLAPSPEVAEKTRKMIVACEAANPCVDNLPLTRYDSRNPFDLCAGSYLPIYRGQDHVKDPLSGACYLPDWKGRLCSISKATEIGFNCQGLKLLASSTRHSRRDK